MLTPSSIHLPSVHFPNPIKASIKPDGAMCRHIYHALKHVDIEPMPSILKEVVRKEHGLLDWKYAIGFHIRNYFLYLGRHHDHDVATEPAQYGLGGHESNPEKEFIIDTLVIEEETFQVLVKNGDIWMRDVNRVEEDKLLMSVAEYFTSAKDRLSGLDLTGLNLTGLDFDGANFQHTNFEGTNLSNTKLVGADLKWANLKGADLTGADMAVVDLRNTQFDANTVFWGTSISPLLPVYWSEDELNSYFNPKDNPGNLLSVIDSIPDDVAKVKLMRHVIHSLAYTNIFSVKEHFLNIIKGNPNDSDKEGTVFWQEKEIQQFAKRWDGKKHHGI